MDALYSVEQVPIPPELGIIMKQYTKAILRDQPADVYKYSANFFAILSGELPPFDEKGTYVEERCDLAQSEGETNTPRSDCKQYSIDRIFQKYSEDENVMTSLENLPQILAEIKELLGLKDENLLSTDEVASVLHVKGNCVDLLELRQLVSELESQM